MNEKKKELGEIAVLPASENPLMDERELEQTHTAFYYERILFDYIRLGDVAKVDMCFQNYVSRGFVMGNMSSNSLRQMQYWAVSGIAVAVHYAILGGLDETDAFNKSDECIRRIDVMKNSDEIIEYLGEKVHELTDLVYASKEKSEYSPIVRKCMHYIHVNLNKKILVKDLEEECKASRYYISNLFHRDLKTRIDTYIVYEKLEASKTMLLAGKSVGETAYYYAFCSEANYIHNFHKRYGITPLKFKSENAKIMM